MAYKDTVEDFNLKWRNSFAIVDNQVVYIQGAFYDEKTEDGEEPPNFYVQIHFSDKTKIKKYDFDLESPTPILCNAQFFNCGDLDGPELIEDLQTACLYYSRWPRRQNKRSICTDNSVLVSPLYPLIHQIKGRWPDHYNIGFQHVNAILTNKYPLYSQALEYCRKHGAVALSPDFAVGLSSLRGDKFLFLSQFGFVGLADESNIYVKHKGSLQEINDFVSRNTLNVRVIDAI